MTRLEERLREAYREAAGTVQPGAIAGLDLEPGWPSDETSPAGQPRRRGRVLMPLIAAASVAAIAAGAALAVSVPATRSPGHGGRERHAAPASPLAALPKYTVLNNGNNLEVVVTATGDVAGRLDAPPGHLFAAIAGTAGDKTFFAAADLNPQTSCQTSFYQFSLNADGQPSALTRLPVHTLPGLPTALAASATGD